MLITLDRAVNECLATHEILRRLGFSADDIYVTVTGPITKGLAKYIGKIQVVVLLNTKSDNETPFTINIGVIESHSRDDVQIAIKKAIEAWNGNGMTEEKSREIVAESAIRKNLVGLLAALSVRGYHVSGKKLQ